MDKVHALGNAQCHQNEKSWSQLQELKKLAKAKGVVTLPTVTGYQNSYSALKWRGFTSRLTLHVSSSDQDYQAHGVFIFQFRDVGKLVIVDKKKQPNLAIDHM